MGFMLTLQPPLNDTCNEWRHNYWVQTLVTASTQATAQSSTIGDFEQLGDKTARIMNSYI